MNTLTVHIFVGCMFIEQIQSFKADQDHRSKAKVTASSSDLDHHLLQMLSLKSDLDLKKNPLELHSY